LAQFVVQLLAIYPFIHSAVNCAGVLVDNVQIFKHVEVVHVEHGAGHLLYFEISAGTEAGEGQVCLLDFL